MAKYASFRELVVWQKGMDEVTTQLELCRRLSLVAHDLIQQMSSLAEEIGRLLFGLWRSLFIGTVCYSLALLAALASMPWAMFQILRL